jgi:UTP--glucose-1-phosphate uridylyltransferase
VRVIVILAPDKMAIRDYLLPQRATASLDTAVPKLQRPGAVEVVFAFQNKPLGLGHAIACARPLILPGPFGVILPDDVILGSPCLPGMARAYRGGHMIAAMEVPDTETHRYGVFHTSGGGKGALVPATGLVEKPDAGSAPSRLVAIGRYILAASVFDTLDRMHVAHGGDMPLTDAINIDAARLPLTAFRFSGQRYDCGTLDGLLAASIARRADLLAASNALATQAVTGGGLHRHDLLQAHYARA